jgi:hypothetical protein
MKLKPKYTMKIESIRTLSGPNVYSYRPVLLMRLDLRKLAERESREFEGFNERLRALLTGIETVPSTPIVPAPRRIRQARRSIAILLPA